MPLRRGHHGGRVYATAGTTSRSLRSTQKSTRGGLDALVACYLTLAGEKGLKLVDELFLANNQAPYADTYARYPST